MPQMMPLSWLLLYFFFIVIFLLFNLSNYYLFNYQIKFHALPKKSLQIYWKW